MTKRPEQYLPTAASALPAFAEGTQQENLYVQASDGVVTHGILYRPPADPDTGTCIYVMHPRGPMSRHYLSGYIPERGAALFGHDSRYLNNDADCLHEKLLLDVAAGMARLRDLGYETIVGVGNSGGGSLFGYYQQQAELPAAERRDRAPSGDAVGLREATMPPFDLYVALAAHPGQGNYLLNALDPSVIDESDPLAADAAYDMYSAANGYQPWPEPSSYAADWLQQYREAQRRRSLRLDALAREAIADKTLARRQASSDAAGALTDTERERVRRRAKLQRYRIIYRTLANPAFLDPTIDPSNRPIGSIFSAGRDPIDTNYGFGGLARVMTPRGWLSTWSGTASYADLFETIRGITVPTLILEADGDMDIYPAQQRRLLENAGAEDKTHEVLDGADHYLNPLDDGLEHPRARAADRIMEWTRERAS